MVAAFVLGEVWQAESSQGKMEIAVVGVFVFCSIFFILRVSESKNRQMIWLEAGCLIFFFGLGYLRMQTESQEGKTDFLAWQQEQVWVEGTLYKTAKTTYYQQYFLKDTVVISGTGERIKTDGIQISVKADCAQEKNTVRLGNRIGAKGVLAIPERATNPGGFDWYQYYRALGIRYQIKADQIAVVSRKTDWIGEGLQQLKERLKQVYQRICTEKDYGIFCAVLLGEKQELDGEVKSLYEENGISHILAISGLHISLIGMGLYRFLRKWFGFFSSEVLAGGVMAAYVLMTGAGVSTVRAYLMFLFLLTAALVGRTYDILTAAGWAALLLLIRNPYQIYYAGFLLSFGAIIGIGVVGSLLNGYIESRSFIIKSLVSSMSVIWVTLPISAYFFFTYAVWSVVLNLIVIPCMALVMISGIVGGLLGMYFPFLGMIGIGMGHDILWFYEKICIFAERLPKHQLLIGQPSWQQIGIYYGMVGIFCLWVSWKQKQYEMQRKQKKKGNFLTAGKTAGCGAVMVFFIAVLSFQGNGRLEVTFLDVSQGDGIFLRLPSGEVCLIDGGSSDVKKVGEYRIVPFLQSERVEELDFVFISHADGDHISGVKEILESDCCRIKVLCLPDIAGEDDACLELVQMAERAGGQVVYLKAGDRISGGEVFFQCVHPKEKVTWGDRNDYSMVLWLRYGEVDFLFTGDIGEEQELQMMSLLPQELEVLKVAHHGSKGSSCAGFLERVSPRYGVISCGEGNSYGHPHAETVERLEECGVEVLMTQEYGAITFVSDGVGLEWEGFLGEGGR